MSANHSAPWNHLLSLDGGGIQQDFLCRVLGRCFAGVPLDSELGALINTPTASREPKHFRYMRYDHNFTAEEQADYRKRTKSRGTFSLDAQKSIPLLQETGSRIASEQVDIDHFPEGALRRERVIYG